MILAPILGLLLIALMRVEHKIELPFCEGCWTRKRIVSVVEILSFLALVASPFAGFVMMLNFDSGYAFFAALGPAGAAVIAVQIYKFTVMPRFRKTDKDQVIVDAAPYGDLVFTKATVATLRTS